MSQAGEVSSTSGPVPPQVPTSFVTNNGTATPAANILNVYGQPAGTVPVMFTSAPGSSNTIEIEDRTWLTRFVVDSSATVGLRGTYQTIGAAITAASAFAPVDIFIRDGTYTEDPVLVPGVNLTAFSGDEDPNVTIIGNCQLSSAGSVTISNINLQTNSNYCVSVTGSANSNLTLENCYINALNNTAINYSTSGSGSSLIALRCSGDIGTTGITLFSFTGSGMGNFRYSYFTNSGGSIMASSTSNCDIDMWWCRFQMPLSSSGSGQYNLRHSRIITSGTNSTCLTHNATLATQSELVECGLNSGSAAACIIGAGATVTISNTSISSQATNVITGSGTLNYGNIVYLSTGNKISVTTQTPLKIGPVTNMQGMAVNYTPTATSYQVLISDCIIGVTSTAAPRTITMPNSQMTVGQIWTIKDESVGAGANNITISGNGSNIIGTTSAATYVISVNGGAVDIYWNGTAFAIK